MEDIEIFNQIVKSTSFSGKSVSKFLAVESEFIDCQFENMRIKDVCFGAGGKQSRYINCSFDNSVFSSNAPGVARFENCSFQNVKIKKFFCVDIEMINCILSGEIVQGNFVGARHRVDGSMSVNGFHGNDFTDLRLDDADFIRIDLTAQRLPVGSDYLIILDAKDFLSKTREGAAHIKGQNLSGSIT